jgi:hypothetical protein
MTRSGRDPRGGQEDAPLAGPRLTEGKPNNEATFFHLASWQLLVRLKFADTRWPCQCPVTVTFCGPK